MSGFFGTEESVPADINLYFYVFLNASNRKIRYSDFKIHDVLSGFYDKSLDSVKTNNCISRLFHLTGCNCFTVCNVSVFSFPNSFPATLSSVRIVYIY